MDFGPHADTKSGKQEHYLNSYFHKRNARLDSNAEFNQIDRDWRVRWQKAQHLSADDGKIDLERNPDYRKARYNIFRRVWRMPMDFVEYNILNKVYADWRRAKAVRGTITMFGGLGCVALYISYYTLYCANDWSSSLGWKSFCRKPAIVPGNSEWPQAQSYERTEKYEYAAFDFDLEKDAKIKTSTPLRYS